ncbi:MAG: thioesterase [Bacteroidales bacterium]|nr:thioesterase [Bacteroidales bacterium]
MTVPEHVFAVNFPIRTDYVDWEKKLSIPGLFLFLQEIAWKHANIWSFGYEQLKEKEQFWVLAKLKVQIDRYLQWNDELHLQTWSKEPELLTAYRDFIGYDQHGALMFKATSAWHVLSMATGRPQRVDELKQGIPIPENLHAIERKPEKLPTPASEVIGEPLKVVLSDIDINLHVNNTRYIQWVLDSFPHDFALSHKIMEIEVNFLQQAKLGDNYYIVTQNLGDGTYLSAALRAEDSKALVYIKTVWN